MAQKSECDTGESKERDRAEPVFLTAVAAEEDGAFPLGTHAAVYLLSLVRKVWKPSTRSPSNTSQSLQLSLLSATFSNNII